MAKKQTRRSISVSRTTYERLKAFCETNNISMSQLVETRVNDFLGTDVPGASSSLIPAMPVMAAGAGLPAPGQIVPRPIAPRPTLPPSLSPTLSPRATGPSRPGESRPSQTSAHPAPASASVASYGGSGSGSQTPMTSAAARFVVDPPPPIIKPRQETAAPKPAEKRPEQIFTF